MNNKILTPSAHDAEAVTAFANYNSRSSAYKEQDVRVALNLLYSEYISKPDARVCWDSSEKMYNAVAPKRAVVLEQTKSIFRTKEANEKYAQDFIRVVIWNFLAALEAGKITSIPIPQCLEKEFKEASGKGDGSVNQKPMRPEPPNDLATDALKNPAVIIGGVVVVGIIGYAVWKFNQRRQPT